MCKIISYKKTIGFIFAMIVATCSFSTSLLANNLDVAEGRIIIKGIGATAANGKFAFKDGVSKSDSILIDEIVITYPAPKKGVLSISDEEGTIFNAEVTKSLTSGEMKSLGTLIFYPQKNYVITHGDNSWNVIFADLPIEPIVNTDSIIQAKAEFLGIPSWRIEEGFDIENNSSEDAIESYLGEIKKHLDANKQTNTPWWIYLIIAILGLACAYLLLPTIKPLLSQKNKRKSDSKQSKTETGNIPVSLDDDGVVENEKLSASNEEDSKGNELIALRAKISSLLQNDYDNDLSEDQKIAKIKLLLETGREAKDGLRMIRHALNIEDENVVPLFLYDKIEELKHNSSTASQEEYKKIRAEICNTLIEKLLGKKNKVLSDIVADAMDEKGTNQYEIVLKIIDLLPFRVKDDKVVPSGISQSQSIAITDNQLKHSSNSYTLKKWLSEQLRSVGITGFDMNKTVLDNLTQIAEKLKLSLEDSSRKSDEEIVDGIILEDKLTDEQKKVLIRRFIDTVNGKIVDSSKSISDSLSLDEFTQSIADALQQPNSHEEAQMQTQQRNIAIVNEALETDMTSLSKDAIKEAVKRIVVGILQSRLSNVSIDTYEDALANLSTCNNQYKEIENLLKNFNADNLVDLPKAIREKQNSEILKSVADKVSKLLPGQTIESVQKLVNTLLKEVDDTRESRDLIADDLEEKISSRDKSYSSSEDKRDVLKLMGMYNDLVKKEDASLREQITTNNEEISQLKGVIDSKTETITSLENDKQNLMSESTELVEDLHIGAEKILESCKTILNPCSDDEEAQCVDIEDRLFSDLNSYVTRLKTFSISKETVPAKTRKMVQDLLINEISSDNSPINTVCRYYAYSRLPFMTDTAREYGITFNRRNMAELYYAIENLYVQFGINLNIPSLFVMGIEEGEFENVTGKMYGDLDNLCQNSRNHFDNIDSATKPSNVIVDVVNVGYSVDGKVGRVTSVLTY